METGRIYYTISEVAQMLGVAASVLRFWETEFEQVKPTKNKRGVRLYTQQDIELLKRIHYLTRDCGYTLEGAKEQLRAKPDADLHLQVVDCLTEVRHFLVELKDKM